MSDKTPGVIARYLTVGGATVDLTEKDHGVVATCNGCPDGTWTAHDGDHSNRQRTTARAGHWAQSHAETCRATARTEAGR